MFPSVTVTAVLRRDVGTSPSCMCVGGTEPAELRKGLGSTLAVASGCVAAGGSGCWCSAEPARAALLPQLGCLDVLMAFFIKLGYVLPCVLNRNVSPFALIEGIQPLIFICFTCLLDARMLCRSSRQDVHPVL